MPHKLSSSDRKKFRKAQERSKNGDMVGCLPLMRELVDSNPEIDLLRVSLAIVYEDIEDMQSAEDL